MSSAVYSVQLTVFYLYEDDGNTTEYMEGTFSNTSVSYIYSPDQWVEVYYIVPVGWALMLRKTAWTSYRGSSKWLWRNCKHSSPCISV